MPNFDWNSGEFDTGAEEEPQTQPARPAIDQLVSELTEEETSTEDFSEEMTEVERRLELAQYYQLLLQDTLFNDRSENAQVVEREIRIFIRQRLGELLGVVVKKAPEPVKVELPFTDDEVVVLKEIAGRMADKIKAKDAAPPAAPPKPEIKKVEAVPAKPEAKQIQKKDKPAVKKAGVSKPAPAPKPKSAPKADDGELKAEHLADGIVKVGRKYFRQVEVEDPADGVVKKVFIDVTKPQVIPKEAVGSLGSKSRFEAASQMLAMQAAGAPAAVESGEMVTGALLGAAINHSNQGE